MTEGSKKNAHSKRSEVESKGSSSRKQSGRCELEVTSPESSPSRRQRSRRTSRQNETAEVIQEEYVPTLEEKRMEIRKKYYNEVRERARKFLLQRETEARLKELQAEQETYNAHIQDNRLSTIDEGRDETRSSAKTDHRSTVHDVIYEPPGEIIAEDNCDKINKVVVDDKESKEENIEVHLDEAADGDDAENEDVDEEPELLPEEIQAMHAAVMEGDIDLLDDILDLPGANLDVVWFGENLLMAAIRAKQTTTAMYLIDNGINVNFEATRLEKREDIKDFVEQKAAALESEMEEMHKSKKKSKKKQKEKIVLEQLETEERIEVHTPDLSPPKALTDMDIYKVKCRDMAVETEQHDIVDLIDVKNQEIWPKSPIARTHRQKHAKRNIMDKLKDRDDWINTDDEAESELEIGETNDNKNQLRKKSLSRDKLNSELHTVRKNSRSVSEKPTSRSQRAKSELEIQLETENNNLNSVAPSRSQNRTNSKLFKGNSRMSNRERGTVSIDRDAFTVAGDSPEASPVPPSPVPLQYICHPADEGPTKTRLPYKANRTFHSRKSANLKYMSLLQQSRMPEDTDERHIAWDVAPVTASKSSYSKKTSNHHVDLSESNNNQARYHTQSSPTRQMSPWEEDDPQKLSNLIKRSHSQITLSPHRNALYKLRKENSLISDKSLLSSGRSIPAFAGTVRTKSNLYRGSKSAVYSSINSQKKDSQVKTKDSQISTKPDNKHEIFITRCRSNMLFSPQKVRQMKTGQTQRFLSLLEPHEHRNSSKAFACSNQYLNKSQDMRIRRYSPAGYLRRSAHSRAESENIGIIHQPIINSYG